MYGRVKGRKIRRRSSFWQNVLVILIGVLTFFLAIEADNKGIQLKWVTALLVTIIPFGMVLYGYRALLRKWSFWAAVVMCLAVHSIAIWILFGYVFMAFQRVSILLWYPFMMAEVFVLVVLVAKINNLLAGQNERIRFNF
jgi:peptidoglycan/LPS O-acetylase OafA/YrhL